MNFFGIARCVWQKLAIGERTTLLFRLNAAVCRIFFFDPSRLDGKAILLVHHVIADVTDSVARVHVSVEGEGLEFVIVPGAAFGRACQQKKHEDRE